MIISLGLITKSRVGKLLYGDAAVDTFMLRRSEDLDMIVSLDEFLESLFDDVLQ